MAPFQLRADDFMDISHMIEASMLVQNRACALPSARLCSLSLYYIIIIYIIIILSLYYLLSLYYHYIIIILSLYYHYIITILSLYYHFHLMDISHMIEASELVQNRACVLPSARLRSLSQILERTHLLQQALEFVVFFVLLLVNLPLDKERSIRPRSRVCTTVVYAK